MSTNKLILDYVKEKPTLYAPSSSKFWDDEHISKGMLEAHLNPDLEAASRKLDFINRSVEWITKVTKLKEIPKLLDLGCGPGLYTERFFKKGYQVTGMDFSSRSINYAKESATRQGLGIEYIYQNYLELSCQEEFDVITLIYCDFGVLSDSDRALLLQNIYRALKPGGIFIFDVFTPIRYENIEETACFEYSEQGFWNKDPHVCLESLYRYDECNTFCHQYVVITEAETQCYNIWEHTFTPEEVKSDLTKAGFSSVNIYGDVTGTGYLEESEILCAVAWKR